MEVGESLRYSLNPLEIKGILVQLYPEDEARLRQRIRQIVLDHIQAMGGHMEGMAMSGAAAAGGSVAGGRKKRKGKGVLAGGKKRKGKGVLAGGVESHREHVIGAKKNAFIHYMKQHGMNAQEASKHYKKMKKHRKKGMGYDIGGKKGKKRGGSMAQKKAQAKNPWLKMVKKYRKQGYSMQQISEMYHSGQR